MLRDDSIHVSGETRRALSFLPHTEEQPTSDAWADMILQQWLAVNHADILAHVRRQFDENTALRQKKHEAAKEAAKR